MEEPEALGSRIMSGAGNAYTKYGFPSIWGNALRTGLTWEDILAEGEPYIWYDDTAAPVSHKLWLNAFSVAADSDEFASHIGHEIIRLLKQSQSREGKGELAPTFAINVRMVAS